MSSEIEIPSPPPSPSLLPPSLPFPLLFPSLSLPLLLLGRAWCPSLGMHSRVFRRKKNIISSSPHPSPTPSHTQARIHTYAHTRCLLLTQTCTFFFLFPIPPLLLNQQHFSLQGLSARLLESNRRSLLQLLSSELSSKPAFLIYLLVCVLPAPILLEVFQDDPRSVR